MSQTMSGADVVSFLNRQHQEVKTLFGELEGAYGEARADMFQCLVRMLAVHETAEEEVIYPVVRKVAGNGEQLASARLTEEAKAKQDLAELERLGVDNPQFLEKLTTLRDAVMRHAESEEREIFPVLKQHVDAKKLEMLRMALETAEKMAPTHPHPHGPESAAGNLVVGPFVAIADRLRDALKKHAS